VGLTRRKDRGINEFSGIIMNIQTFKHLNLIQALKIVTPSVQMMKGQFNPSVNKRGIRKVDYSIKVLFQFCIIIFYLSPGSSQDTALSKKCWRGICIVCPTSYNDCHVTDSVARLLVPSGYGSIQFTDLRNFLIVRNDDGKKGVVNLANQTIVPLEYEDVNVHAQGFIKATSTDSLISLFDTLGRVIIPPDRWRIKIELLPSTYIFAYLDSLYFIYDDKGQRLFDFGVKGYERTYLLGETCFRVTLKNGNQCLFALPDLQDTLSMEYQNIERPKYHKSVTVLTWLTNEHGDVLKQLARGSKRITDPIYKEICFEPSCLEPFKDMIAYDYVKPPKLFYAIGILPDMSMHIFDETGDHPETISRPTPDFESLSEYLCRSYRGFQISNHLMPVKFTSLLYPRNVTPKDAWMIDSTFSSGDTIYYLGSKFEEMVKSSLLSREESEEMIASINTAEIHADTFKIDCLSRNFGISRGDMTITFSEPVFTNERTKCVLTYEILSPSKYDSKPNRTRKTLLLQFIGGKWIDMAFIEFEDKEVSDK
jgi:hypothetical protein